MVGKIFGKAKRRGADTAPVQVAATAATVDGLSEPDFILGDAAAFWRWFAENAKRAQALNASLQQGGDPEELVRPLFNALQRYHGGLSLLVGSTDAGESELVVSADGVTANFPAVTRLVAAAPAVPGWRTTAFKPRIGCSTQIDINGKTANADIATYRSAVNTASGKLDIEIMLPWLGKLPHDAQMQIAFLLLDNLLGEFDVATVIGQIDVDMLGKGQSAEDSPLTGLSAEVDALGARSARH